MKTQVIFPNGLKSLDYGNPFKLPGSADAKKYFSKFSDAVKHFAYRKYPNATEITRAFDRLESNMRKIFNDNQPGAIVAASNMLVAMV